MAELPYQTWQRVTGHPWSEAKNYWKTGTAASNIALQAKLKTGWNPYKPAARTAPKPVVAPKSLPEVTAKLNQTQQDLYDVPEVETREEIGEQVREELLPEGEAPAPISLVETYGGLREEQGITGLEDQINSLTGQEEEIVARMRQRGFIEEGKPVPLNVIAGRVSEADRQERENLDFVQRQKSRAVNELQVRQQALAIIMDLTKQDYQFAVADYDRQFNQNLNVFEAVSGIRRDQMNESQQALANARANLQVYVDLLQKGNLSLSNLTGARKLLLNKMEVQAGFPPGFMASIRPDPDANIITTTTLDDGRIQVFFRKANGQITSKIYGTKVPKTYAPSRADQPTEGELNRQTTGFASTLLQKGDSTRQLPKSGSDGYANPKTYKYARSSWIAAGAGSTKDFDDIFRSYVNPGQAENDYGVYWYDEI